MTPLPYVTSALPGCGGAAKVAPEDFRVDERPLYPASGEGPHTFLRLQKRGLDTRELIREVARACRVAERDVGCAGLKDRFALTTQWLSVPDVDPARAIERLPAALPEGPGFALLEALRHGNKLRTGHLAGNDFTLRLRGVPEGGLARAQAIAAALASSGLPNFYGPQRFGRAGDNAEVGAALLAGRDDPRARRMGKDRRLRRLAISALQSEVFNRVLARRLQDGSWRRALAGDVLLKVQNGAPFVCVDPSVDDPRVAAFECSPSGPLPGGRQRPRPEGVVAAMEAEALASLGVDEAQLAAEPDAPGARRPLAIPLSLAIEPCEDGLTLRFGLPAGSYATVVLRELLKAEPDAALDAG